LAETVIGDCASKLFAIKQKTKNAKDANILFKIELLKMD
jgi:hypothetical protein